MCAMLNAKDMDDAIFFYKHAKYYYFIDVHSYEIMSLDGDLVDQLENFLAERGVKMQLGQHVKYKANHNRIYGIYPVY